MMFVRHMILASSSSGSEATGLGLSTDIAASDPCGLALENR
jgi:hypothetical protein